MKSRKTYQVVIDTNILVSAIRSKNGASYKLLLLLGEDNRWRTNISNQLLFEYTEIIYKTGQELGYRKEGLDDFLDYICKVSQEQKIFFTWRPYLSDPEDDFILDLAFACGADCIITYNKRDFIGVKELGINVITPFEFLKMIGEIK